jgi:hypothetical protein
MPSRSQGGAEDLGREFTALIGVHDHCGDRLFPAAHRDSHAQRGVCQLGVVVLVDGEPDDSPRTHVQHRVEEQLALISGDLSPSPDHL